MRRTKRLYKVFTAMLVLTLLVAQNRVVSVVGAEVASAPSLVISQLKITSSNGQFITLYNATNTALDMGKFQLEYFNNYDLTKATSSKLISLTGTVPPHGYFKVSDDSSLLCYQQTVDSISLGLSSTAGLVEVLSYNQTAPGSSATPALQDLVGWSKTTAIGVQTLPTNSAAFLQRLPVDTGNNPVVSTPGLGSWQSIQPDSVNACNFVGAGSSNSGVIRTGLSGLLPSTEPPATILDDGSVNTDTSSTLPLTDTGLMAPMITEILPNPVGTGNDSTNEFIELYNPNLSSFDLNSFVLQSGITSQHNFIFPSGASLPAQSFTAFYAPTTHLNLSNGGGQVKLLDPLGNVISATAVYGTATNGRAWALANGNWYWTSQPSPGAPNVIIKPASKLSTQPKPSTTKSTSPKAKTTKSSIVKTKSKKTKKAKAKLTSASAKQNSPTSTPIHSSALALVTGLALLYGIYEYRADLANYFHKLRRNIKARRGSRASSEGRRSDLASK